MRLLLDTHVALWSVAGDRRLSREAQRLTAEAELCLVSAVSLLEIAIKHARGQASRDPLLVDAREAHRRFLEAGFLDLAVTARHAEVVGDLPSLHKDPFDRLLVAQARSEPLLLLTQDNMLGRYGDVVIVA